jgi:hypothetical protein
MLLDAGASTGIRDHLLKSTPLGWACRWGRIEIAKLLLERDADAVEPGAEPWASPRARAEKNRNNDMPACCGIARTYFVPGEQAPTRVPSSPARGMSLASESFSVPAAGRLTIGRTQRVPLPTCPTCPIEYT